MVVIADIAMAAAGSYIEIVRNVLRGGCRVILLRDKTTPFEELLSTGTHLKNLTAEYNALLLVNDNPYLAREIDADGVHLGQTDMPVDIAREIVGFDKIIGLTTHNVRELSVSLFLADVDYVTIGPLFSPGEHYGAYPATGLKILEWAENNAPVPYIAVGGITLDNIHQVVEAGARRIGVESAVLKSPDMTAACIELGEIITRGHESA